MKLIKWILLIVIVVVLVVVALNWPLWPPVKFKSPYQAVLLTNGAVYFGKLEGWERTIPSCGMSSTSRMRGPEYQADFERAHPPRQRVAWAGLHGAQRPSRPAHRAGHPRFPRRPVDRGHSQVTPAWGRPSGPPPGLRPAAARPALDHAYRSGLAASRAVTGLPPMDRWMRRNSSPSRTRRSQLSSCQNGWPLR